MFVFHSLNSHLPISVFFNIFIFFTFLSISLLPLSIDLSSLHFPHFPALFFMQCPFLQTVLPHNSHFLPNRIHLFPFSFIHCQLPRLFPNFLVFLVVKTSALSSCFLNLQPSYAFFSQTGKQQTFPVILLS